MHDVHTYVYRHPFHMTFFAFLMIADMIGRPLKDGTFKYREGPQPTARMTTQVSFCLMSINLQMRSHTKTL